MIALAQIRLLFALPRHPNTRRASAQYPIYPRFKGGAPSLADAHWRLGLILEKRGHKPDALAEVQAAVRLDPENETIKKDLKRLK